MKCPVCGTTLSASRCSLCGYEETALAVGMSKEKNLQRVQNNITKKKTEFFSKIQVGIVLYSYDVDENSVEESEERTEVLSGLVTGRDYWLPKEFSYHVPRDSVEVDIYVKIAGLGREFLHSISLRNIEGEEEQKVGLQIDEDLQLRVKMRSSNARQSTSQPQYLFAEA